MSYLSFTFLVGKFPQRIIEQILGWFCLILSGVLKVEFGFRICPGINLGAHSLGLGLKDFTCFFPPPTM